MINPPIQRTRAQESRAAIEKMYIVMRHLFNRGSYKPLGVSGESLISSLLTLRPEIYGSITDPVKVELEGLVYVMERLPTGIEECRFIKLVSKEGLEDSHFEVIIPTKRRRNCYRIDEELMQIEMTRGRSDIYDILTHLTFLYIEAEKIKNNSIDHKGRVTRNWEKLEKVVQLEERGEDFNCEIAFTYLSTVLGRTYDETKEAYEKFEAASNLNSLFHIIYWLGKLAIEESVSEKDREISFSSTLRERIGHHVYGEQWANTIKNHLLENDLIQRPIHIISANLHSVLNSLYAKKALGSSLKKTDLESIARELSLPENGSLRDKVEKYAHKNGLSYIPDTSGTNLGIQVIDTAMIDLKGIPSEIKVDQKMVKDEKPIIFVMDYAFGEQAYETMDELLKPYELDGKEYPLNIKSVSIMGKAGILEGEKGDLMIPTAHVFEGTADNYPLINDLAKSDFEGHGLKVFEGPMVTVLGTSLQNKDVLRYFLKSSWGAIGLEMEGAHYQKAIQSASMIRKSISHDVALRYAYYASDNPLLTGKTLASGSLGMDGVKPTYLITTKMLSLILS
ncbi:MAG: hypothetical protein AAFX87_20865 [Bacteroidota bacterium]